MRRFVLALAKGTRCLSARRGLRMAAEAKERDSREDTLGGFSGVRGRKSRRAFHNERPSQYVVTGRLTLPQPRARRVDNRFREGTTATVPYYRLCGRCLNAAGTRAIRSIHNQRTFRTATDRRRPRIRETASPAFTTKVRISPFPL